MKIELTPQQRATILERSDTIQTKATNYQSLLQRIVQTIADLSGRPFNELRVLDLACAEGMYAVELALQGCRVVAIEGRKANLEKASALKDTLALENLELVQDDVRNLSVERYGHFDVVLCLGILYHLDVPDVFHFVQQIAQVCTGLAIFDTHVSLSDRRQYTFEGHTYAGWTYIEHRKFETSADKEHKLLASLDNPEAFWFTRPSLYNLLIRSGFTSIHECHVPLELNKYFDRITLAAIKGTTHNLILPPALGVKNTLPGECPEHEPRRIFPAQTRRDQVRRSLMALIPARARQFLKKRR